MFISYTIKAHSIDIHWQTDRIMLVWAYFSVTFKDICRMTNIISQMLRKGAFVTSPPPPYPPPFPFSLPNWITQRNKTRDTQSLNLSDRVPGPGPLVLQAKSLTAAPFKALKGSGGGHLFSFMLLETDNQQTCAKQCAPPFSKMGVFLSNRLINLWFNFFSST